MGVEVGKKAPAFKGLDQNGKKISLKDYEGKKLVLFFYPKDMTSTCTVEACNLRDHYPDFQKEGYEVLGVSADDEKRHQKFIAKHDLPYDLLADTEQKVCNQYGVWVEKSMYGNKYMGIKRTTFVIDEKGKIEQIIEKVKSKEHGKQILG